MMESATFVTPTMPGEMRKWFNSKEGCEMKKLLLIPIVALVAVVAGCAAPQVSLKDFDQSTLTLPKLNKSMDRVHDEIAAKNDGMLYVGAAEVDITTDYARQNGIFLGGFDLGRRNTGVRDPIYAHAIFMDDGKQPWVIVTIDTIGYMNDEVVAVRNLATDKHHDRIVVASIHNHVGPDTVGYWGPAGGGLIPNRTGVTPEYQITLRHLIAQAIDQAAENARPARLRFATVDVDPALSLNIHNNIRDQKDNVARLMMAEDLSGKPIAVLANWGCHVEAMWNDTELSADWAGVFYQRIRDEFGAVPMLVEGALGGLVTINPGDQKMALEKEIMAVFLKHMSLDEMIALTAHIGNSFADHVIRGLKGAEASYGPTGLTITSVSRQFHVAVRNFVFEYFHNRGIFERNMKYLNDVPYMTSDVSIMRLTKGGEIVADFTTWPGEPAPTLVADLDAGSPAAFKFTVALGNDETGYYVREADWNNVEYGYERTMSLGRHAVGVVLDQIRKLREALAK